QAIDNVQEQVNTLVLNGDSSVAAKQAAIDANGHDYQNLKLRLDTEHTQLAEQLADTENKINSVIDGSYIVKNDMARLLSWREQGLPVRFAILGESTDGGVSWRFGPSDAG